MPNVDLRPEILRIEELVTKVKFGHIKLPKFQRPFVWNKADILKLLDSIYNGYPIGSVLLWLTKLKLASERQIGDLEINDLPEEWPTLYLLDGQQRLSTLCGALFWNEKKADSIWRISFDVREEVFLYPEEDKSFYFPLNKLINTSDFLNQCKKLDTETSDIENAEKLLKAVKDYKIAAVTLGDMELHEVAPIFERINSTGRQLTMVDLMRAATWKGGFDLNNAIDAVREVCVSKNFENISERSILQNISACAGFGMHKEAIDKLRDQTSDQLKVAASKTIDAHKLAVDFMSNELFLTSTSYLPYSLHLTFLVEFFNRCPKPDSMQISELKTWFWATSLTNYFRGANTGLITKSLKQIREFASKEIDRLTVEKDLNFGFNRFAEETFTLSKASSKTLALMLANKKPRSLLTGAYIDTFKALAVTNRMEFHHIFPRAYLKSRGYSDSKIDTHSNICMLNLGSNRDISDLAPSHYFKIIEENLGESLENVLESNHISIPAFQAGLEDDYEKFLALRGNNLIEQGKQLTGHM